jgi:predicted small metal-binding protein
LPDGAAAGVTVAIPAGCFNPDCGFMIRLDTEDGIGERKSDAADTSHGDNNISTGRCLR